MKNTDPPHRTRHMTARPAAARLNARKPRLTPELHRFIQRMGGYFERSGVPPIGGRILGLLMISHVPLSAEEIASTLKISRGSISTNFRVLEAGGLAERYTSHTDRNTYYVFPDTAWEQAMVLGLRRAQDFKHIVQDGLLALSQEDTARWHLLRGVEYSDLVIHFFERQLEEWRTHHQKAARFTATR